MGDVTTATMTRAGEPASTTVDQMILDGLAG